MSKSLITASQEYLDKIKMLDTLLSEQWDNQVEQEKFAQEIVVSLVGDETNMVNKVQNIKSFIDSIDENIERAKAWKKDITRQEKIAENMKERVKDYTLFVLKQIEKRTGQKYIESGDVKISYQAQGKKHRVKITDEKLIPNMYFDVEIGLRMEFNEYENFIKSFPDFYMLQKEINKDRIINALLAGERVDGAELLPQDEGIRIKTVLPNE